MPLAVLLLLALVLMPLSAAAKSTPYSLAPAPFSGQMPDGWVTKKQTAHLTTFHAPAGTAEAEASVWIRVAPMVQQPEWTIEDYLEDIQRANAKLDGVLWAPVESQRAQGGREVLILPGSWSHKTSVGAMTRWRAVFVFVEFPDYVVIGQYSAPQAYFERLNDGFDVIWGSLTYGAATARGPGASSKPTGGASPVVTGRMPFTFESPAYAGEMPEGWVARRTGEVLTIEGKPGTEPYEMTIRLSFYDKREHTLEGLASSVRAALADLPAADLTEPGLRQTEEGRPARAVVVDYQGQDSSKRTTAFRQVAAVVEHDGHLVVLTYAGPAALHDKYAGAFEMVGSTLRATKAGRAGTNAAAPTPKSAGSQAGMKVMRDDKFGFAYEIPATWTYRVNANKDYVVEGPKGTDAYELSVILQFVTKAANKGSSATAQAQSLVEQIQGAPNGVIKSHDLLQVAGQEAPFFVATYTAKNSTGVAMPFAHTQLVLDHGAYYYLISYSGPAPIYEKYLSVFQHLVETFTFVR